MKGKKLLEKRAELPDLETFGNYRAGLTNKETEEYLRISYNIVAHKKRKMCPPKILRQFIDIAGVNTGAISEDGKNLMYREDVGRFTKKLFFGTETYWD